jgi:hypothetical protein
MKPATARASTAINGLIKQKKAEAASISAIIRSLQVELIDAVAQETATAAANKFDVGDTVYLLCDLQEGYTAHFAQRLVVQTAKAIEMVNASGLSRQSYPTLAQANGSGLYTKTPACASRRSLIR